MNEKPKSIWKKSWPSPRWLRAWLIVVAATFFIVLIVTQFIPGGPRNFSDWWPELVLLLIPSLIIATVAVGLWAFTRWLFCGRHFKRFLFGLACFATLIALIYAEEDWRGKHAWEKFKREWEAKGEHFDFASVVPPPVPDDQNFAMTPVWIAEEKYTFQNTPERAKAWYGDRIYSEEVSNIVSQLPVSVSGLVGTNWWAYRTPSMPEVSGDWTKGGATDLKPWQAYYRDLERTNPAAEIPVAPQPQSPAIDVLLALSKFEPVIEKLRAASALPCSRFPIKYDAENPAAILLPNLAAVKRYAQVLQLRAIAEFQNGQSEKALEDVKLSLRLADAIRTEPFLISHLVRIAMVNLTLQPIYEGLAEHRWSDEQLVALAAELAKLNFLADYKLSMRGAMGCQGGDIDFVIRNRRELVNLTDNSLPVIPPRINSSIPTGWFYQNQLRCARMMVKFYIPLADANQQTISPTAARHADEVLSAETKTTTPYNILEKMLLPALGSCVKKFAHAQSSVDLARVAIALECYRLAHGAYPESLDMLVPQFIAKLPHDIINGQPLHYRRTSDGQLVLYSVGWNETDDGGVVEQRVVGVSDGRVPIMDISTGDWVWRYPAT
jgi:hypothetical protein